MNSTRLKFAKRIVLHAIGWACLAFSILFFVATALYYFSNNGVELLQLGNNTESDGPLTLEQARLEYQQVDFPKDATEIRYAAHQYGLGIFSDFVRFHASLESCVRFGEMTIKRLLLEDLQSTSDKSNPEARETASKRFLTELRTVSSHDGVIILVNKQGETFIWLIPEDAPAWFDVDKIKHGLVLTARVADAPMIWIDTERNTCYFFWSN